MKTAIIALTGLLTKWCESCALGEPSPFTRRMADGVQSHQAQAAACTGGLATGGGGDSGCSRRAAAAGPAEGPCLCSQSGARFPFTATALAEHSADAALPVRFCSSRASI